MFSFLAPSFCCYYCCLYMYICSTVIVIHFRMSAAVLIAIHPCLSVLHFARSTEALRTTKQLPNANRNFLFWPRQRNATRGTKFTSRRSRLRELGVMKGEKVPRGLLTRSSRRITTRAVKN
ncbi:hypothetical protein B0H12DRAFT_520025 [Mycena haematopus]|nr:hypothetical protein B0H12DRAFT_520025 [Mycena haematopus]